VTWRGAGARPTLSTRGSRADGARTSFD